MMILTLAAIPLLLLRGAAASAPGEHAIVME
jgi:hypothetical protein